MVHRQTLDAPTVQTSEKTTCLLVEDNAFVSDAYQIVLEGGGFRVCQVAASEPVPVAFVTGHPRSVLPAPFSTLPYLQKPVSRAALLALVHRLEEMRDR
jgi:hypothetical protein